MPPEKPRRTLLAVLLVAALGLFASTPSSADEPALPQFDPDSVVELENGLNWIDLNGDGVEDPVVMSRSHRRATFMHFDFYLRDLDPVDGNEWSYIDDGSFHAEEEYGCQEYALRVARRLDRPSGPLTVVIAWRLYDDSTLGSCDPRSVEFEFYELVLLPLYSMPGQSYAEITPTEPYAYGYQLKETFKASKSYVEAYRAFEELGLR